MGNLLSKIWSANAELSNVSNEHNNQEQSQGLIDKKTALTIWKKSNKNLDDILNLLQSEQSQQQNHNTVLGYLSMLNNRQKLIKYLWELQKYILEIKNDKIWQTIKIQQQHQNLRQKEHQRPCKLNNVQKMIILRQIHAKYSNIWFINKNNVKSNTPILQQKQIQQLNLSHNFSEKLCHLYLCSIYNQINAQETYKSQIMSALLTNHPLLLNSQTIQNFITTLVQQQVFIIQDQVYYMKFITQLMVWGSLTAKSPYKQSINQYCEKIIAMEDCSQYYDKQTKTAALKNNEQIKKRYPDNWVVHILIEQAKYFLKIGNPHSMQITYQCALNIQFRNFTEQQINLYLFTKIYSLFLYKLDGFVSIQFFQQLYKMQIRDIIHFLLRNNQIEDLDYLKNIFNQISAINNNIESRKDFSKELQHYIFSKYCTLQLCLQIVNKTGYINIKKNQYGCQTHIIDKLKQCKFQLLIQNIQATQKIIENIANHCQKQAYQQPLITQQVFNKISDTISLLYILGINEKVNDIWIFYEIDPKKQNYLAHKRYLQEKALYLLKSLVSKFFINSNTHKNKKVTLNNKSSNPIHCDLSETQSLFQISHYLFGKIFGKVINRVSDLHQIIFQHMLYFYKYQQLKNLVNSINFIQKYSIQYEKLQILIIDNINKQLVKNQYRKIYKDVAIQLKLLKTQSLQKQSTLSLYQLIKYLNDQFSIDLQEQQKQKINIQTLYILVQRYPQKIEVINFDYLYQEIRIINAMAIQQENQLFDPESDAYKITNQLLVFKSTLAVKAYQMNKKKFANQLIQQINRFHPPWIAAKLIQIFKRNQSKPIDDKLFGVAAQSCVRGKDLQYLLKVWKKKNILNKEKRFQIGNYFETGRQYLIIDDQIVIDEQQYRNFIAETKFSDESLAHRNYELFYILLGTQCERAFHHAIVSQLDPIKIDIILKEGIKQNILNAYNVAKSFFKFINCYDKKISYKEYKLIKYEADKIQKENKASDLSQNLSYIYPKVLQTYKLSQIIDPNFIHDYLQQKSRANQNITYQVLYNPKYAKNLLTDLIEQKMSKKDIQIYQHICQKGFDIQNLLQLCIFKLSSKANSSEQIGEQIQNILDKILVCTRVHQVKKVIQKFCDKIFSMKMLIKILNYARNSFNLQFAKVITDRHIQILQSLANLEQGQQFSGLIPPDFFQQPIGYNQMQNERTETELKDKHRKIIQKCRKKTNIFVISKVVSFFYGIDKKLQQNIIQSFMNSQEADQQVRKIWQTIKQQQKLKKLKSSK